MAVPGVGIIFYYRIMKFIALQCFVIFILDCKIALTQDVTSSPICGSSLYDIETLKSVPYWTISRPGICYNSYSTDIPCVINLAFCKDLPPDKSHMESGAGASQQSHFDDNSTVVLGQKSVLSDDRSGTSLFVGYSDGDEVDCGIINVLLVLNCNDWAIWAVRLDGAPTEIPEPVEVILDKENCVYQISVDYAGACEVLQPGGLSAGTVLIIIFVAVVVVYILGGLIYNKAAGARGKELIPNYKMWNNLPSDIMVGCGFFFSCITCQGGQGSSSNSYESI